MPATVHHRIDRLLRGGLDRRLGLDRQFGDQAAATSAGASTASGNSSSTGGSTGVSSTGGSTGVATSSTGGTSGGCLPNGRPCDGNGACCSEACNSTCSQPAGQACLLDGDCSSDNCGGSDICGCSSAVQEQIDYSEVWVSGTCAVDADCCDGASCTHYPYLGSQIGTCCNQVGGSCQNAGECCDSYCVNGACNTCSPSHAFLDYSAGSEEDINGRCTDQADCCPGLVCNQTQAYLQPPPAPDVIATADCCLPNGSTCVSYTAGLDGGQCCSGDCDGGSCVCRRTGESCQGDQACCQGTCMAGWDVESICCQALGATCFSGPDCCTGSCPDGQCACVPTGGSCGPAGQFAQAGPAACCSGNCSPSGSCL